MPPGPAVTGVVNVAPIADQTNSEGDTVSLALSATDANGSTPTWSETGLPAGLGINSSTGAITGTVSAGDFVAGPIYGVQVTASDGTYSGSQTFIWSINNPSETAPTLNNPGPKSNQAGDVVDVSSMPPPFRENQLVLLSCPITAFHWPWVTTNLPR